MTMKLDDAIAHALKKSAEAHACGDEHYQLAQWLIELKARRERSKLRSEERRLIKCQFREWEREQDAE